MIFMSQSGLVDRSRDDDWDSWYLGHLQAMVTAPGISSAQRFRTKTPGAPPSLAAYSVASPTVFEDPIYLNVRGFREWQDLIDGQYYRRNLFEGLDEMPSVSDHECLLVADRELPGDVLLGSELEWLRSVGLDHSTAYRGIAIWPGERVGTLESAVAVYRPVTPRVTSAQ
jgi:hypothetical protein